MSEELHKRNMYENPEIIKDYTYYNLGETTINQLKKAKIIKNVSYNGVERKKVDGLILKKGNPYAIVEWKLDSELSSIKKTQEAIQQEFIVAKKLECKILIITSEKKSIWINLESSQEVTYNSKKINNGFKFNLETVLLFDKANYQLTVDNNNLGDDEVIYMNPIKLSRQVWQDIWTVNGATPENALYTFVEFFIFKYLSDLKILKGSFSFNYLNSMYEIDTEEDVLNYYANTIRTKMKELFTPNPDDGTTIINGTIFVSKDKKAVKGYAHVFRNILKRFEKFGELKYIDYDFKSKLFESFLKESISKKNWGQYFTPLTIVDEMTSMAESEIKEGISICDPACGVGKFLLSSIHDKNFYKLDKNNKLQKKITLKGFDKGFDHDEQKTIILAKANMLIYFSDFLRENSDIPSIKEFSNLLNETFLLKTNSILGTLSEPEKNHYDLILSNPPYVTSGTTNLRSEIQKDPELLSYYGNYGIGIESLFMEWIVNALKPNGKAYIVIPDSMLYRLNDFSLRNFLIEKTFIEAIISLPKKAFFSTSKKTSIVIFRKKSELSEQQNRPIMLFLVNSIGESLDKDRFPIGENDLKEATTYYKMFKEDPLNSPKFLEKTSDRLKFLNFSDINIENMTVEHYFTKEQLVKFDRLEKSVVRTNEEYADETIESAQIISELSKEIKGIENEIETLKYEKANYTLNDLFDLSYTSNSSKFTKKFINQNKGDIPVYGASQVRDIPSYGYIKDNIEGVKYFNDTLTYTIDGSTGLVFYREGRFSLSEKVLPLILKDKYKKTVLPQYLEKIIPVEFKKENFSREVKAGKTRIKDIEISLPINSVTKEPDISIQIKINKKIEQIIQLKNQISEEALKMTKI